MTRPTTLLLLAAALAASACTEDDGQAGAAKEVTVLRADLERLQKEHERTASQVAAYARRLDGLTQDLTVVRQVAADAKIEAAGGPAGEGGAGEEAQTASADPQTAEIRSFLATEEGRRVLQDAVQAEREARDRERAQRAARALVDRFAAQAELTADQTSRMKEVMVRQADAVRAAWAPMQDLPDDATPEQRAETRRSCMEATEQLRKATDEEVRGLLSQAQFEQYQQAQTRLRGGPRPQNPDGGGFPGRRGPRTGGGND